LLSAAKHYTDVNSLFTFVINVKKLAHPKDVMRGGGLGNRTIPHIQLNFA